MSAVRTDLSPLSRPRRDYTSPRRFRRGAAVLLAWLALATIGFSAAVNAVPPGQAGASADARRDLEQALARTFGGEVRIDHPGNGPMEDVLSGDGFGLSVAVDGNIAVVGAPKDDSPEGQSNRGGVHVFLRSGTSWTYVQRLLPNEAESTYEFGAAVAVSGETIVVGSNGALNDSGVSTGAAFVFERQGQPWVQVEKLLPSDGAQSDLFGTALDIEGDTIMVGSPQHYAAGLVYAGAVYAFERSSGSWNERAKLIADTPVVAAGFGASVSLSGTTVVIGAPQTDFSRGAAHVFVRNAEQWSEQQVLLANDGNYQHYFGGSVAVEGERVVVGAANASTPGGDNQGAAYVWVRNGSTWTQEQKIFETQSTLFEGYGSAVAISQGRVLVGSPRQRRFGPAGEGVVHAFEEQDGVWTLRQQFSNSATLYFGYALAMSGDTVLIGTDYDQAFAYTFPGSQWAPESPLIASDGAALSGLGRAVAVEGDTAVIASVAYDTLDPANRGGVFVFERQGDAWVFRQSLRRTSGAAVTAYSPSFNLSGNHLLVGRIVFARDPNGVWSEQQLLINSDPQQDGGFGTSAAISGDLLVIGAPTQYVNQQFRGAAYVFRLIDSTWVQTDRLVAPDGAADDYFGLGVAVSDGAILVAAPSEEPPGGFSTGAVYAFGYDETSVSFRQKIVADDAVDGDSFGATLDLSGNTAAIGRSWSFPFNGTPNAVYVFVQAGSTWSQQQKLLPTGGPPYESFGYSLGLDGNSLAVGAPQSGENGFGQGATYVFSRAGTSWTQVQRLVRGPFDFNNEGFGAAVALSDVSLIVGAPGTEQPAVSPDADVGSAHIYLDEQVIDTVFDDSFEPASAP